MTAAVNDALPYALAGLVFIVVLSWLIDRGNS